jgi:alanine-synthesizing transaminase
MLSQLKQHFDMPTNRLYALKERYRRQGIAYLDLVSGDVTSQGIQFPQRLLESALRSAARQSRIYRPDPLGQPVARQALSRYYESQGLRIDPDQLILTPGTSLSYLYAFKLIADAGDEILCPAPSYPLCESIAALAGVKLVAYRLRERARWDIDFDHLIGQISPRTRGIILVSPHNPTGAVVTEDEIKTLGTIATRNHLPIISDEVFSPFVFNGGTLPRPASLKAPLVITLNGLSKMLALPGMKIGWMALTGDPSLLQKSFKTLEMISDTFLPVNEIAQCAVPILLRQSAAFQASYRTAIEKRKDRAVALLKKMGPISFIEPEGGFFLTLRLEAGKLDEEELAYRLLRDHRILVHPGFFYDMEGQHLVLSYTGRPALLRKTLKILLGETS